MTPFKVHPKILIKGIKVDYKITFGCLFLLEDLYNIQLNEQLKRVYSSAKSRPFLELLYCIVYPQLKDIEYEDILELDYEYTSDLKKRLIKVVEDSFPTPKDSYKQEVDDSMNLYSGVSFTMKVLGQDENWFFQQTPAFFSNLVDSLNVEEDTNKKPNKKFKKVSSLTQISN